MRNRNVLFVLVIVMLAVIPLLAACAPAAADQPAAPPAEEQAAEEPAGEEPAAEEPAEEEEAEEEAEQEVHWGYEGEGGPEHWGDINEEYATCSAGERQSPIDVAGYAEGDVADIEFSYSASGLTILNNGHTVQANYDEGSTAVIDGVTYDLLQFHFHTPSEHTVDGESFAAEMHAVHKNADGGLAVVGILIREGAENPAFVDVLANAPAEAVDAFAVEGVTIDINAMLPEVSNTYRYSGSLTTPPCSEDVSWNLIATPIEMSAEQIATLSGIMHNNNRPVQPLNDRDLIEDAPDAN